MSAGLKVDWSKIQGLSEAIADPACPVSSIYDYNTAEKVDKIFKDVKEGNVLFTQPACPIKCGGAPQKVMWLQEAGLIYPEFLHLALHMAALRRKCLC